MKTETYGAYQLEISDQEIRLHYRWTRNDYLETLLRFGLGIFFLSIFIFPLITFFTAEEFRFSDLLYFPIIGLISYGYFSPLFSRIRKPSKNILYLDNKNATLKIRTREGDLSYSIKELKSLEFTLERRTQRTNLSPVVSRPAQPTAAVPLRAGRRRWRLQPLPGGEPGSQ